MPLTITRRVGESVLIGTTVRLVVTKINRSDGNCRVRVDRPSQCPADVGRLAPDHTKADPRLFDDLMDKRASTFQLDRESSLIIGGLIVIAVHSMNPGQVRLSVNAPRHIKVVRSELNQISVA
jgi:sRNA-binding carbon storage regulator CsrA